MLRKHILTAFVAVGIKSNVEMHFFYESQPWTPSMCRDSDRQNTPQLQNYGNATAHMISSVDDTTEQNSRI